MHEKQCTENVPNLCFESMQGRVMHPVSSTNVNMSLTVSHLDFSCKFSKLQYYSLTFVAGLKRANDEVSPILENSCSFGLRYVSWYKYLTVNLVFSHLGFWTGNLFLIAPFPDLCLLVPFHYPKLRTIVYTISICMFYCFQRIKPFYFISIPLYSQTIKLGLKTFLVKK